MSEEPLYWLDEEPPALLTMLRQVWNLVNQISLLWAKYGTCTVAPQVLYTANDLSDSHYRAPAARFAHRGTSLMKTSPSRTLQ